MGVGSDRGMAEQELYLIDAQAPSTPAGGEGVPGGVRYPVADACLLDAAAPPSREGSLADWFLPCPLRGDLVAAQPRAGSRAGRRRSAAGRAAPPPPP